MSSLFWWVKFCVFVFKILSTIKDNMDKQSSSSTRTPTKRSFNDRNNSDSDESTEITTPEKRIKTRDTLKLKKKRIQKYKKQWELEFGSWLTNDPLNECNGKCKICGVIFTVGSAGIGQVSKKSFEHAWMCEINISEVV